MKLYTTLLATLALCVACNDSETALENRKKTEDSFANPRVVGTLHDGRIIKHITDHNKGAQIYFVDGTVTTNITTQKGKVTVNEVTVMINGTPYVPVEKLQDSDEK